MGLKKQHIDIDNLEELLDRAANELLFFQKGPAPDLGHVRDILEISDLSELKKAIQDDCTKLLSHMPKSIDVWKNLSLLTADEQRELGSALVGCLRSVCHNADPEEL